MSGVQTATHLYDVENNWGMENMFLLNYIPFIENAKP